MPKNKCDTKPFLCEILTEELPPKALHRLEQSFLTEVTKLLSKENLTYSTIKSFATPRRLALLVDGLIATQPDSKVERRGPALKAAFTADGKPTQACLGFAKSLNVDVSELQTLKTEQGEWL